MTKKQLQSEVVRDKQVYVKIKELMEIDLEETKSLLCYNIDAAITHVLQGKSQKLIEYLNLLK